jgi:hypothetical protein
MRTEVLSYTYTHPATGIEHTGRKIVSFEGDEPVYEEELPAVSGERWVELQGFSALGVISLTRFEQSLIAKGLPLGPKMSAVRDWLQSIMVTVATDSSLRTDWPFSPFTYGETTAEAINTDIDT